ncbi:uncharacterized protein PV06_03393 [Exophiala oligosperma]|uniref:Uncharacterized protein n=1 Tax=Exophiala oligosperma TaxID=215243 RepID=A0A0D2DQ66_9EURO|nr:uncharacterized protein PV06_03393 [Exophiala oligosperma]KIW44963.1 hypothetical protein PV06_03393 [Exophiala oligosperma]
MEPPPPPPPPHGSNPQGGGRSGGLPDGRYDIFVIPPHSSGSGFLYLPSLQTQRNSFLAGVFCTAATFFIYTTAVPVVKEWLFTTINSGGGGVFMLICGVAVVAWAFGKTQSEWAQPASSSGPSTSSGPGGSAGPGYTGFNNTRGYAHAQPGPQPSAQSPPPPPPNHGANAPPPQSSWQRPTPQANTKANTTGAKSSWEKAREETRKREEERKRAEDLKRRREELEKERQKQREKDTLERLERERREKKEREDRERQQKEKDAAAKAAVEAAEKENARKAAEAAAKRPPMPSARTEREDDAYSFRPYDRPRRPYKANSAASMYSESSYAPSESTAKTTPPASARGPYSTKDPDKIIIKGVFSFNNAFMRTPISQLVSGQGNVTDGLILRITTEGLFIDDDVRGVPQREWDVKAWTMKLAESCELDGIHVLRASIRDQEGKKYVFILSQSEGWKVAVGLQRLRRGSQVRALGVAGLPHNEAKAILENLGYA